MAHAIKSAIAMPYIALGLFSAHAVSLAFVEHRLVLCSAYPRQPGSPTSFPMRRRPCSARLWIFAALPMVVIVAKAAMFGAHAQRRGVSAQLS